MRKFIAFITTDHISDANEIRKNIKIISDSYFFTSSDGCSYGALIAWDGNGDASYLRDKIQGNSSAGIILLEVTKFGGGSVIGSYNKEKYIGWLREFTGYNKNDNSDIPNASMNNINDTEGI